MTFKSTNPNLTKEQAIEAMGSQKEKFVVTKVAKKGDAES